MLASSPAPAAAFELFADDQLVDGFFLAGHVGLSDAGTDEVEEAKRLARTAAHFLAGPIEAVYAYAASGQIDLILRPTARSSPRALLARLAAGASAKHSLLRGSPVLFDARLYEFPRAELLQTYFRGKQEEAEARLLDGLCARELAAAGEDPARLEALTSDEKRALAEKAGVLWDEIAPWRRRGVGLYLKEDGELVVETELPSGEAYLEFLARFL